MNPFLAGLIQRSGMSMAHKITGVRPWRLRGMMSGAISPATSTINKFKNAYRMVNYHVLRDTGFSVKESNRFKGLSPSRADQKMDTLTKALNRIARAYGKPFEQVQQGVRKSQMTTEDIDSRYPTDWNAQNILRNNISADKRYLKREGQR